MMTPAKEIVKSVFDKYGFSDKSHRVFEVWEQLDREVTRGSELLRTRKGILYIGAPSPVVMHNLFCNKAKIIRSLNDRLGFRYVRELKFELLIGSR